ncbi:MAG: carboxylating nicotinate-nucleotide diphosphorylase [Solirubrobacteraceae bacterium]
MSASALGTDVLEDLVRRALAEDVGTGDVTTAAIVPEDVCARALISQKQTGVIYGLDVAERVFRALDPEVEVGHRVREGVWREGGPVLELEGHARGLLTGERTALNVLAHLSGVATATARAVAEVRGTPARLLDTRKTTPGLRELEKAAVRAGGGGNHRAGLHDMVLIKENHAELAGGVGEAVRRAREAAPDVALEVECRSALEVEQALAAGAERLLLDNHTPEELRAAVAHVAGRAVLEASGNVTLETLREVASTGVDFISMGALTHSAPALDLSLLLTRTRS